jgi:hypothetical protein
MTFYGSQHREGHAGDRLMIILAVRADESFCARMAVTNKPCRLPNVRCFRTRTSHFILQYLEELCPFYDLDLPPSVLNPQPNILAMVQAVRVKWSSSNNIVRLQDLPFHNHQKRLWLFALLYLHSVS